MVCDDLYEPATKSSLPAPRSNARESFRSLTVLSSELSSVLNSTVLMTCPVNSAPALGPLAYFNVAPAPAIDAAMLAPSPTEAGNGDTKRPSVLAEIGRAHV